MNSLELLILDLVRLIYNPTYMVWWEREREREREREIHIWYDERERERYIYGMMREREREREREETYWYDIGIIDAVKMKNEYNVLKKNH